MWWRGWAHRGRWGLGRGWHRRYASDGDRGDGWVELLDHCRRAGGEQAALRDHHLRLLDRGRGDAERLVEQRGRERDAAGAADQVDLREAAARYAGRAQGGQGGGDGALEDRAAELFELLTAERGV